MDNPQVLIAEEPPKPKWWVKMPFNKLPFSKLPLKKTLITLFILAGLGVSLYLVQQKTNLLPKAFEPKTSSSETIFRDNFEDNLSSWKITATAPNTATISTDKAQSGSKSLKLHYQNPNEGVSLNYFFNQPQQGTVSIWLYDPGPGTSMGTAWEIGDTDGKNTVILGVNPNYPNTYYYRFNINYPNKQEMDSKVTRTEGWHKFELVTTPQGSYGKIDGINLNNIATHTGLTNFSKIHIFLPGELLVIIIGIIFKCNQINF